MDAVALARIRRHAHSTVCMLDAGALVPCTRVHSSASADGQKGPWLIGRDRRRGELHTTRNVASLFPGRGSTAGLVARRQRRGRRGQTCSRRVPLHCQGRRKGSGRRGGQASTGKRCGGASLATALLRGSGVDGVGVKAGECGGAVVVGRVKVPLYSALCVWAKSEYLSEHLARAIGLSRTW